MKVVTNLDLNTNQIQNFIVQPLASDPTGIAGRFYYNTGGSLKFFNGSTWVTLGSAGTVDVSLATNVLLPSHGGTGIANADSKTITLGGAFSTTGAYTTNFTLSGNTSVTLPTSGTLVGSADTGTVTNTMLAGSIANAKLVNSAVNLGAQTLTLGAVATTSLTGMANITHLAGTTTVAPINLVSGSVLTTPVAGALEFVIDTLSFTITTGTARKTIAFTDSTLTGKITNLVGAQWATPYQSGTDTTSMLANPAAANRVFLSGNAAAPSWSGGSLTLPASGSLSIPAFAVSFSNAFATTGAFSTSLTQQANSVLTLPNAATANLVYNTTNPAANNQLAYASTSGSGILTYLTSPAALSVLTQSAVGGAFTWATATGTGNAVFASSPTITTPTISTGGTLSSGTLGVSSGATINIASGASLTVASGATFQTSTTPSSATDVVNKSYVDNLAQGMTQKPTARLATAAALSPANTYSNGAAGVGATLTATGNGTLTVDGILTALNDIILVKNEAAGANNGLYQVTTAGAAGAAYVLTRVASMDTSLEFTGGFIPVELEGTANKNSLWLCTNLGAITVGTTAVTFTQLNGATDIVQGTGLTISGNTISIANTITAGGPTGNATTVPVITYNAQGQLTAVSTATITGASPTGATLNSANIWVGTSGNVAAAVGMSGVIALSNTGATTFSAGTQGSGVVVLATSPTLTTPVLGIATATSINKVTITQPTTSATLTLADTSTLATTGSGFTTTLAASATTTLTLPGSSATLAYGVGSAANQLAYFSGATGALTALAVNAGSIKFLSQTSGGALTWSSPATSKFAQNMTGAGPSYGPYTHGLGSADITVTIYDDSGNIILPDVVVTSTQITVTYGVGAPTAVTHRLVAIG